MTDRADAPPTLGDILQRRARETPSALAFRELRNDLGEKDRVTYAQLDARARRLGKRLSRRLGRGELALLLVPGSIDYLTAFFACLYAGVVPVSGMPPQAPTGRGPRHVARLRRLLAVLEASDARAIVGPGDLLRRVGSALPAPFSEIVQIATDEDGADTNNGDEPSWRPVPARADDIAFLQFTSGSTRAPGGVVVRHSNLDSNLAAMAKALGTTPADIGVSWLPLFHDLGLIGVCLLSVHQGFPSVLMPSAGFMEQPRRWLQCLAAEGGTISWAPNFAYKLCLNSIPPEQRAGLDLGRWRVAMNAAEPVQGQTVRRFAEAFGPAGFKPGVMYPSYGLAEATLAVSMPTPGEEVRFASVDMAALAQGRLVAPTIGGDVAEYVGCGRPVDGVRVAVVDPVTLRRAAPDRVGELWVAGPGRSEGYYDARLARGEGADARLDGDEDTWLRTGDLGFLRDGHIFITGRLKDLIILHGANLYPQDIEATAVAAHPALRDDCACAVPILVDGDEALAVICEIERGRQASAREAAAAIRRSVALSHGVETHAVVLIRTASLPKTPSGKVQRAAARAAWEAGDLPVVFETRLENRPASAAPPPRHPADIAAWVVARLAAAAPDAPVTRSAVLADLGLSSAQITELAADIEATFGRRIAAAELFEFRLASDIVDQLARAVEV